jgi:hypothetical protein
VRDGNDKAGQVEGLKILSECDLWLTWVPGDFAPPDRETFYDNRPLADSHTRRLNEFPGRGARLLDVTRR